LNGDITADIAIGSVEIAGVDTVNVTTADRNNADSSTTRAIGYTLDFDATATVLSTMNISGASEFTFVGDAASVALATVNAANLTGDLNLNLSAIIAGQGASITGGAGTNTITGSAGDDTIIGGARADSITAGAGNDVMTGGAGADTFTQATGDFTAATAATLAAAADSITDFASGADLIDWSANITIVADATATAGDAAVNAEGIASFAAADDTLAERITAVEASISGAGGADGEAAIFTFGNDTYVFISEGTAGVGAGDGLIKLVGVTGLKDSTITAGSITIA
jgi:Ca2+-binding RTX toxin-like protein